MALPTRFHQAGATLAAVAAAGYCVEGAIVVRAPQGDSGWHASGYAVEAAFVVALLASLPLVERLRHSTTRVARGASWAAGIGFVAMLVSATASLVAGRDEIGPAFFLGVVAAVLGLGALSVAEARRRAPGWWAAPAVAVGLVLSMALGDNGGGILLGLAWVVTIPALRGDALPAAHAIVGG